MVSFSNAATNNPLTPDRRHLLHLRVRLYQEVLRTNTDPFSPVIIAENMIGCAMYELVCAPSPISGGIIVDSRRSVLVMTTLWVRLFESKTTRPQFKSTKRLVCAPPTYEAWYEILANVSQLV